MKRVFVHPDLFRVPDGTLVAEMLLVEDGFNLAPGIVEPGITSKIHVHPFVTQVTYVLSGELTVWMRGPKDEKPYSLELMSNQACLTEPETFFQLINPTSEPCQVLYIVSPPFLYETDLAGKPVYNDAVVLDESWQGLREVNYDLARFVKQLPTVEERQQSAGRLAIMRKAPTRL